MAINIMPPPDDYDDTAQFMPTPDDYDYETACSNTEEKIKERKPNNSTLTASYPSRKRSRSQSQGDVYQKNVQVNEQSIGEKMGNGLLGTLSTYLLSLPLKAQTIFFMKWINGNFNFNTRINEDFKGEKGQDFHSLEETKCTKLIARCMSSLLLELKNNNALFVCLFFTLFSLTSGNSTSAEWKINSPIVLGECMTLEIFIPTKLVESENGTNTWRGGQDDKIISFDTVSSNSSKYEVKKILSGKGSVHTLVIKDVSETDLNVNYIRQIGFTQFITTLNLNDNVCVRLPNNNTIHKYLYIEGNRLNGQIVLDAVYPSPNCRFSQGTTLIDVSVFPQRSLKCNNIEILRSETKTSIASKQVVFSFNGSVVSDCGNIIMICLFATITISEVFVVENCTVKAQEYKERSDISLIVGCSNAVLAFIILVISLYIHQKRRKRAAMVQSDKKQEQHNDESTLRMMKQLEEGENEK